MPVTDRRCVVSNPQSESEYAKMVRMSVSGVSMQSIGFDRWCGNGTSGRSIRGRALSPINESIVFGVVEEGVDLLNCLVVDQGRILAVL